MTLMVVVGAWLGHRTDTWDARARRGRRTTPNLLYLSALIYLVDYSFSGFRKINKAIDYHKQVLIMKENTCGQRIRRTHG